MLARTRRNLRAALKSEINYFKSVGFEIISKRLEINNHLG